MLEVWPTPFIFWTEVKDHKKIKEQIFPIISEQSKDMKYYNKPLQIRKPGDTNWNCEVITTYFDREDVRDIFTEELINKIIGEPLEELFLNPKSPINTIPISTDLAEIWYNVYKEGYSQEIHGHHGATFSGIYILDLNEPNTTAFSINNQTSFSYNGNGLGGVYTTDHIKEGNVIIFPAELMHFVRKCKKSRCTIAFNLVCKF